MSFVGEPYEYDLFVGYSHGAGLVHPDGGDFVLPLRDWTRNVAHAVSAQLGIGLSVEGRSVFKAYIDQNEASASPLEEEIRRKAQSSALMLIFMSPSYLRSVWSQKEIGWFFERADQEGNGLDRCVLRLVQETPNDVALPWPPRLLDSAGNRVTFGDPLYDRETNVPIELGLRENEFRELRPNINSLVVEIANKLRNLKKHIAAARALEPPPKPPAGIQPIVYVQGYNDCQKWNAARDALTPFVTILPDEFEALPSDLEVIRTFRDRRLLALTDCNGLVLLRSSLDDPVRRLAINSQFDLGRVQETAKHNVPWVLVDFVDEEKPSLAQVQIPVVPASDSEWPRHALRAIGLS